MEIYIAISAVVFGLVVIGLAIYFARSDAASAEREATNRNQADKTEEDFKREREIMAAPPKTDKEVIDGL